MCEDAVCGFLSWVPEHLWWEPVRWMSVHWMSYQCKGLLITCQFSFRMVILDFPLFDLFPFFMLEAFLKYLLLLGCLYVRVKHSFNRSWQKSEDADRACTLMDWNLFFCFLGTFRFNSTSGKWPASARGGDLLNFSRTSCVHPSGFTVSDAYRSWAFQGLI